MDHISLLPPEFYEAKKKERRNRRLLIAFIAITSTMITFLTILTVMAGGSRAELELIENRFSQIESQVKELEEYEKQQEDLELMNSILVEAIGYNPNLPNVIKEISKVSQEEIFITKMQVKYDYDKEKDEDGNLSRGGTNLLIKGALYGDPLVLSYWDSKIKSIDKVESTSYRYMPSSQADSLGRDYQQVEMNIRIVSDEAYRPLGGFLDER